MKFLTLFVFLAIAGTLVIYYGMQPLRLAMGLPQQNASTPADATVSRPVVPKGLHYRVVANAQPPIPTSAFTRSQQSPQSSNTPLNVEALASSTAATAAPSITPEISTPSEEIKPRIRQAPCNQPLPPPTPGSKAWGITISRANYYSLSNKWCGHVPGGLIVDIEDSRTTQAGEMSLGRVERDNVMTGPYLVDNVALVRFSSPRTEVPAETIATLKQYYELKDKLNQRIEAITRQTIRANPETAPFIEAKQKYEAFERKVNQLVARRDVASGEERSRLIDELREMIPAGQRLKNAADNAKPRYDQWMSSHSDAVSADVEKDAQVHELRQQISVLEPKVRKIF